MLGIDGSEQVSCAIGCPAQKHYAFVFSGVAPLEGSWKHTCLRRKHSEQCWLQCNGTWREYFCYNLWNYSDTWSDRYRMLFVSDDSNILFFADAYRYHMIPRPLFSMYTIDVWYEQVLRPPCRKKGARNLWNRALTNLGYSIILPFKS